MGWIAAIVIFFMGIRGVIRFARKYYHPKSVLHKFAIYGLGGPLAFIVVVTLSAFVGNGIEQELKSRRYEAAHKRQSDRSVKIVKNSESLDEKLKALAFLEPSENMKLKEFFKANPKLTKSIAMHAAVQTCSEKMQGYDSFPNRVEMWAPAFLLVAPKTNEELLQKVMVEVSQKESLVEIMAQFEKRHRCFESVFTSKIQDAGATTGKILAADIGQQIEQNTLNSADAKRLIQILQAVKKSTLTQESFWYPIVNQVSKEKLGSVILRSVIEKVDDGKKMNSLSERRDYLIDLEKEMRFASDLMASSSSSKEIQEVRNLIHANIPSEEAIERQRQEAFRAIRMIRGQ